MIIEELTSKARDLVDELETQVESYINLGNDIGRDLIILSNTDDYRKLFKIAADRFLLVDQNIDLGSVFGRLKDELYGKIIPKSISSSLGDTFNLSFFANNSELVQNKDEAISREYGYVLLDGFKSLKYGKELSKYGMDLLDVKKSLDVYIMNPNVDDLAGTIWTTCESVLSHVEGLTDRIREALLNMKERNYDFAGELEPPKELLNRIKNRLIEALKNRFNQHVAENPIYRRVYLPTYQFERYFRLIRKNIDDIEHILNCLSRYGGVPGDIVGRFNKIKCKFDNGKCSPFFDEIIATKNVVQRNVETVPKWFGHFKTPPLTNNFEKPPIPPGEDIDPGDDGWSDADDCKCPLDPFKPRIQLDYDFTKTNDIVANLMKYSSVVLNNCKCDSFDIKFTKVNILNPTDVKQYKQKTSIGSIWFLTTQLYWYLKSKTSVTAIDDFYNSWTTSQYDASNVYYDWSSLNSFDFLKIRDIYINYSFIELFWLKLKKIYNLSPAKPDYNVFNALEIISGYLKEYMKHNSVDNLSDVCLIFRTFEQLLHNSECVGSLGFNLDIDKLWIETRLDSDRFDIRSKRLLFYNLKFLYKLQKEYKKCNNTYNLQPLPSTLPNDIRKCWPLPNDEINKYLNSFNSQEHTLDSGGTITYNNLYDSTSDDNFYKTNIIDFYPDFEILPDDYGSDLRYEVPNINASCEHDPYPGAVTFVGGGGSKDRPLRCSAASVPDQIEARRAIEAIHVKTRTHFSIPKYISSNTTSIPLLVAIENITDDTLPVFDLHAVLCKGCKFRITGTEIINQTIKRLKLGPKQKVKFETTLHKADNSPLGSGSIGKLKLRFDAYANRRAYVKGLTFGSVFVKESLDLKENIYKPSLNDIYDSLDSGNIDLCKCLYTGHIRVPGGYIPTMKCDKNKLCERYQSQIRRLLWSVHFFFFNNYTYLKSTSSIIPLRFRLDVGDHKKGFPSFNVVAVILSKSKFEKSSSKHIEIVKHVKLSKPTNVYAVHKDIHIPSIRSLGYKPGDKLYVYIDLLYKSNIILQRKARCTFRIS